MWSLSGGFLFCFVLCFVLYMEGRMREGASQREHFTVVSASVTASTFVLWLCFLQEVKSKKKETLSSWVSFGSGVYHSNKNLRKGVKILVHSHASVPWVNLPLGIIIKTSVSGRSDPQHEWYHPRQIVALVFKDDPFLVLLENGQDLLWVQLVLRSK